MAVELTGEEARGLLHRVFGLKLTNQEAPLKVNRDFDSREVSYETAECVMYVTNDWLHKDGRLRVGVRDKTTGQKVEMVFNPIHQRDFRAEGQVKLRYDRGRREYWVRTMGPEAAKEEVDQIYNQIYK